MRQVAHQIRRHRHRHLKVDRVNPAANRINRDNHRVGNLKDLEADLVVLPEAAVSPEVGADQEAVASQEVDLQISQVVSLLQVLIPLQAISRLGRKAHL